MFLAESELSILVYFENACITTIPSFCFLWVYFNSWSKESICVQLSWTTVYNRSATYVPYLLPKTNFLILAWLNVDNRILDENNFM